MLNENIKRLRKAKGLSQKELAVKLNVVRQTVSKWEQGLSVPDSDMLIKLAEVLDTKVSILLGKVVEFDTEPDIIIEMSEKLEVFNQEYANNKEIKKKIWRVIFLALGILCALKLIHIAVVNVSYILMLLDSNTTVSIMGSADGHTTMFVISQITEFMMNLKTLIPPLAGLVIAIIGIKNTKKK